MRRSYHKVICALLVTLLLISSFHKTLAQSDQKPAPEQMACDEQQALLLINQQIEAIKSLEVTPAGIQVLIRAADLLWTRQQEQARAVFTRAYEMAEKDFQEKGDAVIRDGKLNVQLPDQRFSVMQAIARHDSEWAGRLARHAAEETRRQAEEAKLEAQGSVTSNTQSNASRNVYDKMLTLASVLIATDEKAAISLAGNAMASATPFWALRFLLTLAMSNTQAADQLCRQALSGYGDASLEGVFYMAGYVFVLGKNIGPSGVSNGMYVPPNLSPNSSLQQFYLETLFRYAQQSLRPQSEYPVAAMPGSRYPEAAELYIALGKLEPYIAKYQPAYSERAAAIKNTLRASLASDIGQEADLILRPRNEGGEADTLEGMLDRAERESNPDLKDQHFTFAALSAIKGENAERVVDIARKVTDEKLRSQLLNAVYFRLTHNAIEKGDLDEARRLVANIEELDQRAYLSYKIAAESLKKLEDRVRAREALDEVVAAALKAPNTDQKARTIIGVAHLFAKFDSIRAFEVMAEAVKAINYIDNPDFRSASLTQRIEGASFSTYSTYPVEGFSLETSFRQLAPLDFAGALLIAQGLENRPARATAILALAASCLENAEKIKKENPDQKQEKKDRLQKQLDKKTGL